MSFERATPRKKRSPLAPLFGLIVLVGGGALAFLIAPAVITWAETTQFTFGAFDWEILPLTFPEAWPDLLTRGVVALFIFLLIFTLFMLGLFLFMRPEREETDVQLQTLREEKARMRKKRR